MSSESFVNNCKDFYLETVIPSENENVLYNIDPDCNHFSKLLDSQFFSEM